MVTDEEVVHPRGCAQSGIGFERYPGMEKSPRDLGLVREIYQ